MWIHKTHKGKKFEGNYYSHPAGTRAFDLVMTSGRTVYTFTSWQAAKAAGFRKLRAGKRGK